MKGDDCFHVHYAYEKIRKDFLWHDETNPERGPAPFTLAKNITKALTTAQVKEHQFMENTHSRLHKETSAHLASKCEPGSGSREEQRLAKWQRARFMSAGGKTAYHWLGMLPRAARIARPPLVFESHLFRIALQYRSGIPCVSGMVAGGRCRCKTRQAKTGKRSVMDKFGFHLSACPWGGWRISRHDKTNHEVGCGVREAGNDATWTDARRLLDALPTHRKEKGSRTRRHRIPDIVSTDQNNERAVFDLMCTRVKPNAKKPLQAAIAGEKGKTHKYHTFIQRCADENPDDPRLRTTVVPVVFETHGAAGPEACAMFTMVRHQFSNVALPCEDKSSEAIFFSAWMHRVSTTLQRGTALMIYNIARGNTTKARRTKEDEFEPKDDDGTEVRDTNASYESEIDLSEESASDSDAECDAEEPGVSETGRRPNKDRKNRNNYSNIQNSAVK